MAGRLSEPNLINNNDPGSAYFIFMTPIQSSNEHFRNSSPSPMLQKENRRPWRNKDCYAVLRRARKAYTESRDSPLSADKREVWRRAEALKRKHIN
jgi:hypothetical protein